MPELPEVENFARLLQSSYAGKVLSDLRFHRPDLRFPLDQKALRAVMRKGSRLVRVGRDGKRLVLEFEAGRVFVSLGMSGQFHPAVPGCPMQHEHVTWVFGAGAEAVALAYVDPRRFGFLSLTPPPAAANPLSSRAVGQTLWQLHEKGVGRSIKDVLMDQSVLAGVGNIYALEACFMAKVAPLLPVCRIKREQCFALGRSLRKALTVAIRMGGSSIATYRNLHGEKGSFQDMLCVYGREGKPCVRRGCGGTVVRAVSGGRSTFWCPECQI